MLKPKEYKYLLSGILKCGHCGSHFICVSSLSHTKKRFSYYVCGRAKQGLGCHAQPVSATMFDNTLLDYFKKASRDQDIIVQAIGSAILESQATLMDIEEQINILESRLNDQRKQAQNLIDLAMNNGISQGATYKARMGELEAEILKGEDKLGKLQAEKAATQMTAHSGEFLHANLRFAMEHIDKAPPDAQKSLLRALIQEILIFDNKLQIRMFIDHYIADSIPPHVKESLGEFVPING